MANKNDGRNPEVRRQLFQENEDEIDSNSDIQTEPIDFEKLLQENLKKHREEMEKKYNFRFEDETPLEGDWEWTKVSSNDDKSLNKGPVIEEQK